jgi:deoxyribodipyrimidine photo-lyase
MALAKDIGGLVLEHGDPRQIVPAFAKRVGATKIVWNRCYEPWAIERDKALKTALTTAGHKVESFNGNLLFEPWEIKTGSDGPFKVYTPFWRACLKQPVRPPESAATAKLAKLTGLGHELADLKLLPAKPNWAKTFAPLWTPGEVGAHKQFEAFLDSGINGYGERRNRPDLPNVSRLSPHLRFGEISPRQIYAATTARMETRKAPRADGEKFLAEIGWREFAYHLLYHFPTLPTDNWKPAFNAYPWRNDANALKAWQRGQTGYPIVDAGMRELWQTGYMHNRVRMITASFLIKHLRTDWRHGEAWFWDTLLDADAANNAASWQWVAGSGADAAPYFRIFNPISQGQKFDPDGAYVRRWCPELAKLPTSALHAPFEAAPMELAGAGVKLGVTYPKPIVDHAEARAAAMAGYDAVKAAGAAA